MKTWFEKNWLGVARWCGVLLLLALILFAAFGCGGSSGSTTVGNGKIDPVEAATLRVAVGLAFTARPDTVAPAHAVATALLNGLSAETIALPLAVDTIVAREVAQLHLDPATLASFNDLLALIKAEIMQRLPVTALPDPDKRILVRQLITIIQETAAARMGGAA